MELERSRCAVFLLVALAGFVAGLAMGQIGACNDASRTRIEWPTPPHPRSLEP
jgi:hypothetical protein